ncbi:fasciclin-like arabinogalactan protein 17 [Diospyros lotus]|uniref:fasciclin-like arabinogalactan protein 17 n=1 Tax=Diospyros lotus TaxID=55363 RepID=UPI002255D3C7|nr:fasciclin-like arabinogalactan protein 17 [Diospyros lotus]
MAAKLSLFLLSLFLLSPLFNAAALAAEERTQAIASNSVLIALLDSRYTELVEKASLLQALEGALSHHRIAIFAPGNEALERELDPEFRRFLLEPRNLGSLQTLLLHHVVPLKIGAENWPASVEVVNSVTESTQHPSLAGEPLELRGLKVVSVNDIVREDGVIHGIDRPLIPKSVQQDFNQRRSLVAISAVRPEGAPAVDPRPQRREKPAPLSPALQIYETMASAPSSAPASASGPGGPRHHLDGEGQVKDFIQTLLRYGGYNEMADILVNLTNLAGEMSKLVSEGYVLTVLAPNDEAMAKLTPDKLGEPGSPEQIIYYHIIPEYQTEESMYNAVRRFGRVRYDTLLLSHNVVAQEADGSVKFGDSDGSAYLFDPDIYVDGHISVQGIDGVLFPPEESKRKTTETRTAGHVKVVAKPRRGKLLEAASKMLGVFG